MKAHVPMDAVETARKTAENAFKEAHDALVYGTMDEYRALMQVYIECNRAYLTALKNHYNL